MVILLLLFQVNVILAAPVVILDNEQGVYPLGLHLEILEDVSGKLSFEQVSSPQYSSQFVTSEVNVPNFGFTKSNYWVKVSFQSNSEEKHRWLLELSEPKVDIVDVYLPNGVGGHSIAEVGDFLPFKKREIKYHNFLFQLLIEPEQQIIIYLHFRGGYTLMPLTLYSSSALTEKITNDRTILGIAYGIMLAMMFYNLFLYFGVRDKSYIYYVLYILGMLMTQMVFNGIAYQYFWPDSPWWGNHSAPFFICFFMLFGAQFSRSYLETKSNVPLLDTVIKGVVFATSILMVFGLFIDTNLAVQLTALMALVWAPSLLTAGVVCLRKNYMPARFYMLAWTFFIFGIFINGLRGLGFLPSNFITEFGFQIGAIIEMVLLSLGLAHRINILKKEKILAQQEAIKAFESSLELKTNFITSVSHELRTPMHAIFGGLQAAQEHPLEHLKPPLDIVQLGASDMMNLVNDILIHTEIQSERLTIHSDNIDFYLELKILNENYQKLCNQRGLKLDWVISDNVPQWICTDRDKLIIVITKLLDNAVKFTRQGRVLLSIECEPNNEPMRLIIKVKDTGIGISDKNQDNIFESFAQKDSGFQRRFGGLGIGLSICKQLIEKLYGRIELSSELGVGSLFTVSLPVSLGVIQTIDKQRVLASADLPILVVEDNVINQKVIVKLLEKIGYSAIIANHGQEALELLEKEQFSLILMDIQMPVMDGFICTKRIRNRDDELKDISIIAVTANVMDADKNRCIESGMNDFLKKPIGLDSLGECLSNFVEKPIK